MLTPGEWVGLNNPSPFHAWLAIIRPIPTAAQGFQFIIWDSNGRDNLERADNDSYGSRQRPQT